MTPNTPRSWNVSRQALVTGIAAKVTSSNFEKNAPDGRKWCAKAAATVSGGFRNTPQPQAPSTRRRRPLAQNTASTFAARADSTPGRGPRVRVCGPEGPGIGRGGGHERHGVGLGQQVPVVVAEHRHRRREDHAVAVAQVRCERWNS
jgi:hypothetical protein